MNIKKTLENDLDKIQQMIAEFNIGLRAGLFSDTAKTFYKTSLVELLKLENELIKQNRTLQVNEEYIEPHTKLLTDNLTIKTLIVQCEKLANEINNNKGLNFAFDNEKGLEWDNYLLIVKYFDEVFYLICERDNLSVDDNYSKVESAIKTILPTFIY